MFLQKPTPTYLIPKITTPALQIDSLREATELEQEGWRAAMAERARRELADREAQLKSALTLERDEQIQVRVGGDRVM